MHDLFSEWSTIQSLDQRLLLPDCQKIWMELFIGDEMGSFEDSRAGESLSAILKVGGVKVGEAQSGGKL